MSLSRKIGPHIIGGTSLPIGQPTLVKLVDVSTKYYWQIRGIVGPDCLIVVRWTEPNDYQPLDNPVRRAGEWWARRKSWVLSVPSSENTVYCGRNEIPDSHAVPFCAFEIERMRLLHGVGRAAAVGSWSVGCPAESVYAQYASAIAAMGPKDVVDLHEYCADHADIANPWHVCRFTLPEAARAFAWKRIVVTEVGRDIVEGRGKAGWQLTATSEEFLADLQEFGRRYDVYPQVAGAAVYQLGSVDAKWQPFNCYGIWPDVVDSYPPKATPPPVEEDPTVPVIPYFCSQRTVFAGGGAITDIVLHDTEGSAQAALNWWKDPNNPGRSSAHVLVTTAGQIIEVIPYYLAAHHAGYGTIPGREGLNPNGFTLGIELEYPNAPASPTYPEVQLAAAATVVSRWAKKYSVSRDHVWTHREIDPTRRSDPRNLDVKAFLDRVWPPAAPAWLPSTDSATREAVATGDMAQIWPKRRWWNEQAVRELEGENTARALAILKDMATPVTGLDYQVETLLA